MKNILFCFLFSWDTNLILDFQKAASSIEKSMDHHFGPKDWNKNLYQGFICYIKHGIFKHKTPPYATNKGKQKPEYH